LLDKGKTFRESVCSVINARKYYLSLGVNIATFAVLKDLGKSFREL
jgi:hypothetical protein